MNMFELKAGKKKKREIKVVVVVAATFLSTTHGIQYHNPQCK